VCSPSTFMYRRMLSVRKYYDCGDDSPFIKVPREVLVGVVELASDDDGLCGVPWLVKCALERSSK